MSKEGGEQPDKEEVDCDENPKLCDEDGNPRVQEESVGPGGEEVVDDD